MRFMFVLLDLKMDFSINMLVMTWAGTGDVFLFYFYFSPLIE